MMQFVWLEVWLWVVGYVVIVICELGGILLGMWVCEVVFDLVVEIELFGEFLLYFVSCVQFVCEVLCLVLECGEIVLCDCYVDFLFVYQGVGWGFLFLFLCQIIVEVMGGFMFGLMVLFDFDFVLGL